MKAPRTADALAQRLHRNPLYRVLAGSAMRRAVSAAAACLVLNALCAGYYGVLGCAQRSAWLLVLCVYTAVLAVARLAALVAVLHVRAETMLRCTGAMLMLLSLVLLCSVCYCVGHEVAQPGSTVSMIIMAMCTFYKVIAAFVHAARALRQHTPLLIAIRSVACADAAAAILPLQRAMLVSFPGMAPPDIRSMNLIAGLAVYLFVFVLGLLTATGFPPRRPDTPPITQKGV